MFPNPESQPKAEAVHASARLDLLQRDSSLLESLMKAIPDMIYFKDRQCRFIRINDALATRFGMSEPVEAIGKTDADVYASDIALEARKDEDQILATGEAVVAKRERINWPDGRTTWTSTTKVPMRDAAGEITGIVGISRDITPRKLAEDALKESERRFRSLFESTTEGVAIHRLIFDSQGKPVDYEIVEVNPGFERQTGIPARQANGRSSKEVYGTGEPPYLQDYSNVALTGEPCTFETDFAPLQRRFSISVFSPKPEWFVTVFRDVTERSRKDAEIRRLNRIYAVLSQVNQAVVRVQSSTELFPQVCDITIKFGEFKLAWIGWVDPDTQEVHPVASAGATAYLASAIISADDRRPEGNGPTGNAIRSGNPYICNDFESDRNTVPWRRLAAEHGLRAAIALPIRQNGVVRGALTVYASEKNFFQSKEVELFIEVAGDISFALDHLEQNARRMRAEVARTHSLSLLRATLESTADGILVVDLDRRIVDYNEQFARMWHIPVENLTSANKDQARPSIADESLLKPLMEQLSDPEAFIARVLDLYSDPEKTGFDVLQFKDGRVFERYSIPQRIGGTPVGRVWSFLDVTERVRAEEALRQRGEQHRLMIEHLPAGMVVHAPDTRITLSNPEAVRLLGLTQDQLAGRTAMDPHWRFFREDGSVMPLEEYPVQRVIATRQPLTDLVVGIEGENVPCRRWVLVNGYPEFDSGGQLQQIVITFVDITERRRSEAALKESESKYRLLFTASLDATILLDQENRCIDCNETTLRIFGCKTREEILGRDIAEFSAPAHDVDSHSGRTPFREWACAAQSADSRSFEWMGQRADGTQFPAEVLVHNLELGGSPVLQAVVRDITWRKATEQQLRQLSRAVEQSPNAVIITNIEGNIEYVNPKFTALTGYSLPEVFGKKTAVLKSGLTPPELYADLWRTIRAGREWRGELCNKKKTGELFWESTSICPITDETGVTTHYLSIKEDITERKLMTERFLRAQRMESIGSLAGGVAHDLNNIFAPIMMSASLLNEELPEGPYRNFVATIEEAAQRGADIVRQLLTFARGVEGQRTTIDPKTLFDQLERILRETFPKSIAFNILLAPELWPVVGDLTQLHQVLLNLCVNARDAMPEGGHLVISAENCAVDDDLAALSPDAKTGRHVRLTVIDSGTGIPREIIEKIFDPFFTTKEPGKGTGLGLSTALGIVRSHGGFLLVDSEPGKGSTFRVFLPAGSKPEVAPRGEEAPSIPHGNGETILLVDDEPEIIKIMQAVLTRNGYKVVTARDGLEALALYRIHSTSIDLVLTDLMMPRMDGVQLARALKKLDEELVVVATSGHGEETHRNELLPLGVDHFLSKPFTAPMLLSTLHNALVQRKA